MGQEATCIACCSSTTHIPDESSSRLSIVYKGSISSRKIEPTFELGGIDNLQETARVFQIKSYYLGLEEVAIGKKGIPRE